MIRQSQNLFAAAVSAALLNAAAVGAFVLFTVLSSVSGFPLRSVIDAAGSIAAPSQSSASRDGSGGTSADVLSHRGGIGSGRAGAANAFGDPTVPQGGGSAGGSRAGAKLHQAGSKTLDGQGSGSGALSGGGSGSSGSGGSPGGSATPALPPSGGAGPVASAVQQVGSGVANTGTAVNNTVGSAVSAAGGLVGSSASGSSSSAGSSGALLGPGSAVNGALGGVRDGSGGLLPAGG